VPKIKGQDPDVAALLGGELLLNHGPFLRFAAAWKLKKAEQEQKPPTANRNGHLSATSAFFPATSRVIADCNRAVQQWLVSVGQPLVHCENTSLL
jgi:hypothetical protein